LVVRVDGLSVIGIGMVLDAATTRTRRTQATQAGGELARLGPVELADLLLTALAHHHVSAVSVEPRGDRHLVQVDLRGTTIAVGALDGGTGDAACARLALVAGIDLGARDQRLGRAQVRIADHVIDLLIAVRPTPAGLGVAIHRIAGGAADELGGEASNRYRLLDELGQGGMGVVYRAEHIVLQKPVAIKVLRPGLADDPVLATQFVLEARAACRARHPGIVDVTDFGRLGDGRAFIVMELVEGETLARVLQGGALPPRRAVALARRIANALRAAGDAGIVHRDLKPSNVFVLADDHVKIGDFGVACIVDSARAAASGVVGTVGYMAPEQARGEPVDARADLYALGCVLYEMLVGHAPFAGTDAAAILAAHASAPVPPIDSPHGPIPAELARVVERAMAKRSEERYAAASEIIADLNRAAEALGPVGWRRWQP
jgi:serine/threonine-protein kinase